MLKRLFLVGMLIIISGELRGNDAFKSPKTWKNGREGAKIGYDEHGRAVEIALPNGKVVRTAYDANGRSSAQRASDGTILRYQRDASGRMIRMSELDSVNDFAYDGNRLSAHVRARSDFEFAEIEERTGVLLRHPIALMPVMRSNDDRAAQTRIGDIRLKSENIGSGQVVKTVSDSTWTYNVNVIPQHGYVKVDDSNGWDYLVGDDSLFVERAGARTKLASATFDDLRRPLRVIVGGGVVITYEYGVHGDWTAKTVSKVDGTTIRRYQRADYPDPALVAGSATVYSGLSDFWLEATATSREILIRTVDRGFVVSTVRVSSDGQSTHVFSFAGLAGYTGDEIRVLPDGTLDLAIALPHAESTSAARTVFPLRISLPLSPVKHDTGSSSFSGRLRGLSYRFGTLCEWIPGGSVVIEGIEHKVAEGRWDCYQTWYWVPDSPENSPVTAPVPGTGGSGGTGGCGTVTTPTPTQWDTIAQGEDAAFLRLNCMDSCESLFEPFGQAGFDVLGRTKYFDGSQTDYCQSNSNLAAWTRVGWGQVYVCKPFETLSAEGAAIILLHEALHTAGMNESNCPGEAEMTSQEINWVVGANCNLQF